MAVVSVGLAALIGSILGISAGFFRGWLDQVVSRFVDILFAFPAILLALAVVTALGNGWQNTAIAIAVVYTPIFARVSRGPTLSVGKAEYIKAQRVLGIPPGGSCCGTCCPTSVRRSSCRSRWRCRGRS